MTQFQIRKDDLRKSRLVHTDEQAWRDRCGEGDILVRVERFGFSANNVTYAVTGDRIGYWKFFPPEGDDAGGWGVMPVWGFADVVLSKCPDIAEGERLFGYFPPASHLVLRPEAVREGTFIDATPHRAELPRGYNIYRRMAAEPGYDRAQDNLRMLLFPLYVTSWCLWDALSSENWMGAEQIIIVSASSKTAIGLAQALRDDKSAPRTIGVTSARNEGFVEGLGLYGQAVSYDDMEAQIANRPSVIVDMSGSGKVLGRLHKHLGDNMIKSIHVGLTRWDEAGPTPDMIRDRGEFFFAPGHIQKRMKEWGADEFNRRSGGFILDAVRKSATWLEIGEPLGLDRLTEIYDAVRDNRMGPEKGLVFVP